MRLTIRLLSTQFLNPRVMFLNPAASLATFAEKGVA